MGDSGTLLLRARVVVPIGRAPIENGAVAVRKGRLMGVGQWSSLRKRHSGDCHDLGEAALMPGLVNAHCHLDYTEMAGLFPPQRSFTDWIKLITTEKAHWTYSDFAQSWVAGAKMLLRSGTTTVADIEAIPELLPEVWDATPLRVISFLEMTGVKSRRQPELILREAVAKIDSLRHDRCAAALSPHAPYSTPPALLRASATLARRQRLRITTHVAESASEFKMFSYARGEMFDWLERNQRDMGDCGRWSPVRQLARQRALGRHLLAIHANYLGKGDVALLARSRTNVVHCPRSHDYFGHDAFPFAALARAGVNICLGTDSLATVRKHPKRDLELSLFHETRKFAEKHPDVPPETILRMATANGAKALGLHAQVGELRRGACADLITIPFSGRTEQVADAIVHHAGDVTGSMVGGEWFIAPK